MRNGDIVEVREYAKDAWACPVCGSIWPYPPIRPPEKPGDYPSFALGDLCECGVEYGLDLYCVDTMPSGFFNLIITECRIEWLDRAGWSKSSLQQLHDNLGISEEEARRQAEEVAKMRQEDAKRRSENDDKGQTRS